MVGLFAFNNQETGGPIQESTYLAGNASYAGSNTQDNGR